MVAILCFAINTQKRSFQNLAEVSTEYKEKNKKNAKYFNRTIIIRQQLQTQCTQKKKDGQKLFKMMIENNQCFI